MKNKKYILIQHQRPHGLWAYAYDTGTYISISCLPLTQMNVDVIFSTIKSHSCLRLVHAF